MSNEPGQLLIGPGKSLADSAYDRMRALINDGSWSPRSRLPSETSLAAEFGVSRPVVRRALAQLRDEGLIQSRQGSGSFVLARGPAEEVPTQKITFPQLRNRADISAFVSFREGIEGEIAGAAALNHTRENLRQLQETVDTLTRDGTGEGRSQEDFAFHLALAQASGNPFYVNIVMSLRENLLFAMGLVWQFSWESAQFRETVRQQHQSICDAVARRHPEDARAAMRTHVEWSAKRLQNDHDD